MSQTPRKVILDELNEVPRRVFERFVTANPRSTLARMFDQGRRFTTISHDEGILSPWITWPTVHRGVTSTDHCISDFGQNLEWVDRRFPPIWQLLAGAGVRTGVFGSLHSYPMPDRLDGYAFYVPDTFAADPECYPERLSLFQDLNLRMVAASGRNVSQGISLAPALRFLLAAPELGLRAATLGRLAKQVADERRIPTRRVRRRTSQVQIAFDLYEKLLDDHAPAFSSFFTNHVASAMHRYWPATFPEDYRVKQLEPEWRAKFADEIDFTMREADRQLGRLVRWMERHPGHVLLLMTSMGQAAVDDAEVVRTQLYIGDLERFLSKLGVAREEWEKRPAMLPRYVFQLTPAAADKFRALARTIEIAGEPLALVEHEKGVFRLSLGHLNLDPERIRLSVGGVAADYREFGLVNTSIEDETGSYAYHVPEGVLLVFDPSEAAAERAEREIPTTAIAPALLEHFRVPVPSYMRDAGALRLDG